MLLLGRCFTAVFVTECTLSNIKTPSQTSKGSSIRKRLGLVRIHSPFRSLYLYETVKAQITQKLYKKIVLSLTLGTASASTLFYARHEEHEEETDKHCPLHYGKVTQFCFTQFCIHTLL